MTDLVLSILFSTGIYIVFGVLRKLGLPALPSILCNYFTAGFLGFTFSGGIPAHADIISQAWFPLAVGMGLLFVSVFFLVGLTSQTQGMTVATVASKMSMAIPVVFAIAFLGESLTLLKVCGFILALLAVYLTSLREGQPGFHIREFYLPLLVFAGSGLVDVAINYAEHTYNGSEGFRYLTPVVFLSAGITGTLGTLLLSPAMLRNISWKSVAGGVVLGITNYLSLVYMIRALATPGMESSILFPINNLGIVCLTALAGFLFFSERPGRLNLAGLAAGAAAVVMMSQGL